MRLTNNSNPDNKIAEYHFKCIPEKRTFCIEHTSEIGVDGLKG